MKAAQSAENRLVPIILRVGSNFQYRIPIRDTHTLHRWFTAYPQAPDTEVVAIDEDAVSVCVRYLDAMGEPELVNTETWISADEVIALDMGAHSEGPT